MVLIINRTNRESPALEVLADLLRKAYDQGINLRGKEINTENMLNLQGSPEEYPA